MGKLTFSTSTYSQKVSLTTSDTQFICSAKATSPQTDCSEHGTLNEHVNTAYVEIVSTTSNSITLKAKNVTETIDDAGYFTWTSHNVKAPGKDYSLRINLKVNANTDIEELDITNIANAEDNAVVFCYNDNLTFNVTWKYIVNGKDDTVPSNYPDATAKIKYNGENYLTGTQGEGNGKNKFTFTISGVQSYFAGNTRSVTLYISITDKTGETITESCDMTISLWDWESGFIEES